MRCYGINTPADISPIMICTHDEDASVQPILRQGIYEPQVQLCLSHYCIGKERILDIGANYGQHTILMSKLNPQARIMAIEASEDNIEILNKTIELNHCTNIEVKQAYLLEEEKEIVFYHEKGNAACAFSCSTEYGSQNHPQIAKTVTSSTLDKIVDFEPDFIKMDIEGAELFAIRGGKRV